MSVLSPVRKVPAPDPAHAATPKFQTRHSGANDTVVQYSEAPAESIKISKLSSSRFMLQQARLLPFRDDMGRVNTNLVRKSIEQIRSGAVSAPPEVLIRLEAWQRHAEAHMRRAAWEQRHAQQQRREVAPKKRPWHTTPITGAPQPHPRQAALASPVSPSSAAIARRLWQASEQVSAAPGTARKRPRRSCRREVDEQDLLSDDDDKEGNSDEDYEVYQDESDEEASDPKGLLDTDCESVDGLEVEGGRSSDAETSSSLSDEGTGGGVWEVEKILREDPARGFLIRWAGFGEEDDSWEPEANVSRELVRRFRTAASDASANRGQDYGSGRARRLWCATCNKHAHVDNFSSVQRRAIPAARACLTCNLARRRSK